MILTKIPLLAVARPLLTVLPRLLPVAVAQKVPQRMLPVAVALRSPLKRAVVRKNRFAMTKVTNPVVRKK